VIQQEKLGTREKIIKAAIFLFSDKGYSKTSVRDIAKEVMIKPASLYSHFTSKEEILHTLYDRYLENQNNTQLPDINDLLKQVETMHPMEVLKKVNLRYISEATASMSRIAIIGFMEWKTDKKSEEFFKKAMIDLADNLMRPLLEKMLELKKIEPLNIDAFICLVSSLAFSAVLRNHSAHPLSLDNCDAALRMVFSLIKTIE